MKFFKGLVLGALFGVPAVYFYDQQIYAIAGTLIVCALVGGVLVELEVI